MECSVFDHLPDSGEIDCASDFTANGNRDSAGYATGSDNQMTAAPGLSDTTQHYTYAYDFEGNTTDRFLINGTGGTLEHVHYVWDYRNRLVEVDTHGPIIPTLPAKAHYAYNFFDQRISKAVDTDGDSDIDVHESYFYDGANLVLVSNGDDTPKHRYLMGTAANEVFAEESVGTGGGGSNQTRWAMTDHLGTVRDIVDNAGSLVNTITYRVFGGIEHQTDAGEAIRFGFTGYSTDLETGLYQAWHRYYDPYTGRFISVDPIGFRSGQTNLYPYCENDPINRIDPDGMTDYPANWAIPYTSPGTGPKGDPNLLVDLQMKNETWNRYREMVQAGDVAAADYWKGESEKWDQQLQYNLQAIRDYLELQANLKIIKSLQELSQARDAAAYKNHRVLTGLCMVPTDWVGGGLTPAEQGELEHAQHVVEYLKYHYTEHPPWYVQWFGPEGSDSGYFWQVLNLLGGTYASYRGARVAENTKAVKPYEVDTYENLKTRSPVGDGLSLDHQPSNASNIARAEAENGGPLSQAERNAVRDQGTAVVVPEDWHAQQSPTYGGRNTPAQIQADAANPQAAAARDSQAMIDGASSANRAAAEAAAAAIRSRAGQ